MDGDTADLQQLCEIKKEFDAFLYVDEAHAVGVRGTNGLGCCEEQACMEDIDFIVGTFGKAFASMGAFVVCEQVFRDYLINTQRSLIFTTALPPVNVAWTRFIPTGCPIFTIFGSNWPKLLRSYGRYWSKKDSKPGVTLISYLWYVVLMRVVSKCRNYFGITDFLFCRCGIRPYPKMKPVSVSP